MLYLAAAAVVWIATLFIQIGGLRSNDPVTLPVVALTTVVFGGPWLLGLAVSAGVAHLASSVPVRLAIYLAGLMLVIGAAVLYLWDAPNAGNPMDWTGLAERFILPCLLSALVVTIPVVWSNSQ